MSVLLIYTYRSLLSRNLHHHTRCCLRGSRSQLYLHKNFIPAPPSYASRSTIQCIIPFHEPCILWILKVPSSMHFYDYCVSSNPWKDQILQGRRDNFLFPCFLILQHEKYVCTSSFSNLSLPQIQHFMVTFFVGFPCMLYDWSKVSKLNIFLPTNIMSTSTTRSTFHIGLITR